MIVQNASEQGYTDMTFTVRKEDLPRARKIAENVAGKLHAGEIRTDTNIAKISIIGVGMRSAAGVAAKMFDTLARAGVNIQMISTSEIKVSCVIEDKYTELAVRELHNAFELHKPAKPRPKKAAKKQA
jgi:aspartate kinase